MSSRLQRGALITFSGVDCSGKSTQLEILEAELRGRGVDVARVWNRVGYTAWFQALKDGVRRFRPGALPAQKTSFGPHKELAQPRTRTAWFVAAAADLTRLYSVTIARLLRQGTVVLCDRYLADSHVDLLLHFPEVDLPSTLTWKAVVKLAPAPDLSLFFDVPLHVALARAEEKQEVFRQPDETVAARIAAYAEAAPHYPQTIVDGNRGRREIADELAALVDETLGSRFRTGPGRREIIS